MDELKIKYNKKSVLEKMFKKIMEEKFQNLIKDYAIDVSIDTFPKVIQYKNSKDDFLFEKYAVETFISYNHVWSIFEKKYNMDDKNIKLFLEEMLFKYFNINKKINDTYVKYHRSSYNELKDIESRIKILNNKLDVLLENE